MKKIFPYILGLTLITCACSDYDDIAQWNMLQNHDVRITELEEMCNKMNTNISSLKQVVSAIETGKTVSQVSPIMDGSVHIGYTIMFSDGSVISLYNGKDGVDGTNGVDGINGSNGKDGVDGKDGVNGHTPVIGVKKVDGVYYWTLDGELIRNDEGDCMRVTGENGKDGKDGIDGINGTTPMFKIMDDKWHISYDEGQTWTTLGQATGGAGGNGKDGVTPKFQIVDGKWQVSYNDGGSWTILGQATGSAGGNGNDGKTPQFRIVDGKWDVSYDNGSTWATLGQATGGAGGNGKDGVTPKFQIVEGKWQVSYDDGDSWTILGQATGSAGGNGNDGKTPQFRIVDGKWDVSYDKGTTWTTLGQATGGVGDNGKDGATPKFQIVEGKWQVSYDDGDSWTILGQATGSAGGNGNDGKTPQFRIVDGKWDVSYDNGSTWATLGQATGGDGGNGKDGVTPKFQIADGKWQVSYDDGETWTILGQATGSVGGNGKDGVTPQLKIEDGYWYVSYDNKKTWNNLGVKAEGKDGAGITVSESGNVITISDGKGNSYSLPKATSNSGFATGGVTVVDGHEAVDLGLTSGLKWATMNIGANAECEIGDYFAFGEINAKEFFESNWQWRNVSPSSYITDGKLKTEYDAATQNWGEKWHMPTKEEMQELIVECMFTMVSVNGNYGCMITGRNGNRIFLPACGYHFSDSNKFPYEPEICYYWGASADIPNQYRVDPYHLVLGHGDVLGTHNFTNVRKVENSGVVGSHGSCIRPVTASE